MLRVLLAIIAIACIVSGTMLVTQQGLFADNISFDPWGDSSQWSNKQNPDAKVSVNIGKGGPKNQSTVFVPPPQTRHSH